MASNVEIKVRLKNPARFRRLAEELADRQETLEQEDTFFACPRGRLKLRRFPEGIGELIYYERADEIGPRQSQYWISRTEDVENLFVSLSNALGVFGIVRKTREVFLVGQTRIHFDDVEDLGIFAELEVVLKPGQTLEDGMRVARELMQKLEIDEADSVECAYIDLFECREPKQYTQHPNR